MGSALAEMLPYAIGLLISPLPIAAVAVLAGGREGARKGIVFCVTWWLVCFVVVLVLSLLASIPMRTLGVEPDWDSAIKIILGLTLLVWAVRSYVQMRRGLRHTLPGLAAMGAMSPDRLAATVAWMVLEDPLRLSMLIAAALELGAHHMSALGDLPPALVFAVVSTITVALALFVKPPTQWLLRNNDLLVFATSLCFGAALLINGLRQL